MFEPILRDNLLALARAFARHHGLSLKAVSRLAQGDGRFFDSLSRRRSDVRKDRRGSFTIRKYDEIVGWFAENWDGDSAWPRLQTEIVHAKPGDRYGKSSKEKNHDKKESRPKKGKDSAGFRTEGRPH